MDSVTKILRFCWHRGFTAFDFDFGIYQWPWATAKSKVRIKRSVETFITNRNAVLSTSLLRQSPFPFAHCGHVRLTHHSPHTEYGCFCFQFRETQKYVKLYSLCAQTIDDCIPGKFGLGFYAIQNQEVNRSDSDLETKYSTPRTCQEKG